MSSKYYLAVDIGNTHSVIGLLKDNEIIRSWRISTNKNITCHELAPIIAFWLHPFDLDLNNLSGTIISSVVPPVNQVWLELAQNYFKCPFLDAHDVALKIIDILYPRPHEIGTDRLINAIGAYQRIKGPCIIADFGTATTFDCVSEKGEYLGGSIAPGIYMSLEALFSATSKLPLVRLDSKAVSPIGKSTEEAIRSGILYGFAGLTDRIITELEKTYEHPPTVIATGGLAPNIFSLSQKLQCMMPDITMEGLSICIQTAL